MTITDEEKCILSSKCVPQRSRLNGGMKDKDPEQGLMNMRFFVSPGLRGETPARAACSLTLSLLLACGQGGQHLPRTVSLFLPLRVTSQCPYLLLQGMRGVRNPAATRAPPLFDGALEECEKAGCFPPGLKVFIFIVNLLYFKLLCSLVFPGHKPLTWLSLDWVLRPFCKFFLSRG